MSRVLDFFWRTFESNSQLFFSEFGAERGKRSWRGCLEDSVDWQLHMVQDVDQDHVVDRVRRGSDHHPDLAAGVATVLPTNSFEPEAGLKNHSKAEVDLQCKCADENSPRGQCSER